MEEQTERFKLSSAAHIRAQPHVKHTRLLKHPHTDKHQHVSVLTYAPMCVFTVCVHLPVRGG